MSSSATKKAISDAAATEFIAHGYAGTSLSSVADRLGLTKGALVYHFPAKSDFASYFIRVVHDSTAQADAFSRQQYPECGSRRLLLYFMLMGVWRERNLQQAAGMSLFSDKASPAFGSDIVIREWLSIGVDAFELCKSEEELDGSLTALEAAEMFLVTNLGATVFARHVRFNEPGTKPMRFVRLALTAVGIPHVDEHAEAVIERFRGKLPEFQNSSSSDKG